MYVCMDEWYIFTTIKQYFFSVLTLNKILAFFYLRELLIFLSQQCSSSKGICWHGDIYRGVQISCSIVPSGFVK